LGDAPSAAVYWCCALLFKLANIGFVAGIVNLATDVSAWRAGFIFGTYAKTLKIS
jgi:hypothetical protein